MKDYFSLYSKLFNAITDALDNLAAANYGVARDILTDAQKETESQYIDSDT